MIRAVGAALLALALAGPAGGHEVRPAYLELSEAPDGDYQVLFKVPLRGPMRLDLRVRLPEACRTLATPERRNVSGASLLASASGDLVTAIDWDFADSGGLGEIVAEGRMFPIGPFAGRVRAAFDPEAVAFEEGGVELSLTT